MSFKCSVFGHAYGDSEIEREREEEGSEVVTTIRELQTCKRCGDTRVVSENKEVTTLETAADIVAEDLEPGDDGSETAAPPDEPPVENQPAEEPPVESRPDDRPDDGAIVDAETGEQTAVGTGGGADPQPETPETPDVDAEEDDGVILDEDEEEEPERAPGEWPEEPDDGEDDWRPETDIEPDPEVQVEPTGSAVTVPEGEFHCPECGFTTPAEESSLRRGDFCPECHRGSLELLAE